MQQIRIQVLFSEDTPKGRFQDALYFTEEEYKNVKQADLDKAKKKRKDKWLEIVSAPSIELTPEEQAAQLQEQISVLQEQLSDVLQKQLNELGV